ncbi:protein ENHANCED DOWNY MILDEW 2 isoform X3 [Lathyrus oleraceus]|uniref:protein ENHANCED DOWNY MILDEW 2 isoform X3 n=1 Tax=Pisum sativum TaxID=3888 RepID=UPI0021D2DF23|nr:protein ENHANCED DOWNY MILDEW 2-like isoform X3 [Pisum sativum]
MKRRLAISDDEPESETEFQSLLVSNYHLEDDEDEPVSFSVLPIQWSDSKVSNVDDDKRGKTFLHGTSDSGLQKIFMQVTAWKFDISGLKPEVLLLSKDGRWIKLQKPRKSFQDVIKTVLITLYFLHCVKKKPRLSTVSFWSNLCKDRDLSSYGFKPSHKDLLDHMPLIGEATRRDVVLARSKLLLTVLGDKPEYQKLSYEEFEDLSQPGFRDDDTDNDIIDETDEDSKVEDDLFDSVCAICDNGGDLLMCDGACMRSFHATKADGRESLCDSLGFTKKQVDDIETFYCKNCEYRQHQCFACGELGSSDKDKGAEVIKCASETCDRFYHPHCVAKLLPPEKHIAEGKPFTCPIHFCCVCKGLENKMEHELQFGVCNRCPKSYHRKCLPIGIAFDIDGVQTRAWEGLLPNNRILIYCLNHEIIDKLGTPVRDHVKFPDIGASVLENNISNKRMKPTTKERVILENNVKSSGKSTAAGSKATNERVALENNVDLFKSSGKSTAAASEVTGKLPSNKSKSNETSGRVLTENKKSVSNLTGQKLNASMSIKPTQHDNHIDDADNETLSIKPIGTILPPAPMSKGLKQSKQLDDADDQTLSVKPIRSVLSPLDADSEKGLVDSFKEARSSILLEGVVGKQKLGDVEDKLVLNHDLPESIGIQEEQVCVNESQKRSSRLGSLDGESDKRQEFKMNQSWKTSGKRKQIKKNDRRGLGVSSQLFTEKDALSKAKTKTRPVKEGSSHQRKTRSETKSFQTPERVVPAGFAAGPNYEYSLHHSAGWLDE